MNRQIESQRRERGIAEGAAVRRLIVPAVLCIGLGAFSGAACNATPAQKGTTITDGIALAGCVLSQIFAGITDPAQLLSCLGATEKTIVDVIDDFTTQHSTDAGLAAVSQSLTQQQIAWLQQARTNAVAALAKKATAK